MEDTSSRTRLYRKSRGGELNLAGALREGKALMPTELLFRSLPRVSFYLPVQFCASLRVVREKKLNHGFFNEILFFRKN